MAASDFKDDEALLNLQDKSNDDLRRILDELSAEEDELSFKRRMLHGRIDILRAELVRRLADDRTDDSKPISGFDIDKLIEILAGDLRRPSVPAPGDHAEPQE